MPPPPPEPTAYNRTRLLVPLVTHQAAFEIPASHPRTQAATAASAPPAPARCTSSVLCPTAHTQRARPRRPIAPSHRRDDRIHHGYRWRAGLLCNPNFRGYVEIDCAFIRSRVLVRHRRPRLPAARRSPALMLPRERSTRRSKGSSEADARVGRQGSPAGPPIGRVGWWLPRERSNTSLGNRVSNTSSARPALVRSSREEMLAGSLGPFVRSARVSGGA